MLKVGDIVTIKDGVLDYYRGHPPKSWRDQIYKAVISNDEMTIVDISPFPGDFLVFCTNFNNHYMHIDATHLKLVIIKNDGKLRFNYIASKDNVDYDYGFSKWEKKCIKGI